MNERQVPAFKPDELARLQVVTVDGGKRIALIDPDIEVDGEPIQHFVFDISQDRTLGDFFQIVLGPSLLASGISLADFLSRVPRAMQRPPSSVAGEASGD